ncbi:MAG: CRTAC1 family protein [Acidobacteria bacterium]|nr:CRTAC1 family protein [Acidobacteriota bacterium]
MSSPPSSPATFRTRAARRTVSALLLIMAVALPWARGQDKPARHAKIIFRDVLSEAGITYHNVSGGTGNDKAWLTETIGCGVAWLDYDLDGNLDLYLINGSTHDRQPGKGEPNLLYHNDGNGRFTDVTSQAGVGDRSWGFGVAVGDVDNDGDPDLYVTNLEANVLYRNNGDGTYSDITSAAGVAGTGWGSSSAFFDMEGDGDLDLYVGNYVDFSTETVPRKGTPEADKPHCLFMGLPSVCGPRGLVPAQDILYRNNGDGTFTDVTRAAGVHLGIPRFALGVVVTDFDRDGDMDIYVANDSVSNSLWKNNGNGTFTDAGMMSMSALSADGKPQAGMGTDAADFDGDGWIDLAVTNFSHDLNTIYKSAGGRFFLDQSSVIGMGPTAMALSWGVSFQDFDRDGDLDLYIANGHTYPWVDGSGMGTSFRQRDHLFINQDKKFKLLTPSANNGLALEYSTRGAAFADFDNDGDVDIALTTMDDSAALLRNDSVAPGHWLMVHLTGTVSNRDAVGARVILIAAGISQLRERKGGGSFMSSSDPRLYFGLGDTAKIDRLEIFWPSGQKQVLTGLPVDQVLQVTEPRDDPVAQPR